MRLKKLRFGKYRNKKCPCESGRKFKRCCWSKMNPIT